MTPLPTPLPRFDRNLLRLVERLVPSPEREDWSRTWHAELWHMHHPNRRRHAQTIADLSIGLTRDALWLRTDSWRRAYTGTAVLCLAALFASTLLATLIGLLLTGSRAAFAAYLAFDLKRTLVMAALVLFVAFATTARRHIEPSSTNRLAYRIKRQLFLAAKILQFLVLALLLSADLCQPLMASFPNVAIVFQVFFFVLIALVGLRWALRDQEQRCKQCLQILATPARVGRPSHNLLEWNGTELSCKQGHGLLSVPEIETSWCQSSQWIDWNQPASI